MRRVLGVALAGALAGCLFSPDVGDGAFACATDGSCPPGFSCAADGRCRHDAVAGLDDAATKLDAAASLDAARCRPLTCAELGNGCSPLDDGCGGRVVCHTCAAPQTCGGPMPGTCGCMPQPCGARNCGQTTDGCGKTLMCGDSDCKMPPGSHCGGAAANVCGMANCKPTTCQLLGANCGLVSDGCSAVLSCGACGPTQTCGGGGVANVCG